MGIIMTVIIYGVLFTYLLAGTLYLVGNRKSKSFLSKYALVLAVAGCVLHFVLLVMRTVLTGMLPLTNGLEFLLTFTWITVLMYLTLSWRYHIKAAGGVVMLISALMVFVLIILMDGRFDSVSPLMPALKALADRPRYYRRHSLFFLHFGRRFGSNTVLPGGSGDKRRLHQPAGKMRFCPALLVYCPGSHLGGTGLGTILVLGSKGNLGFDNLAYLRGLPPSLPQSGMARQPCPLDGDRRFSAGDVHIFRSQLFAAGIAQLRLRPCPYCCSYFHKYTSMNGYGTIINEKAVTVPTVLNYL